MISTLVQAHKEIEKLNTYSKSIPDTKLFTSMYVRKEALISLQIEGTQATLEDLLDPLLDVNKNRNVEDVVNYVAAIEFAVKRVETLPISLRLIRETQGMLMSSVRGFDKRPGEFRVIQNWIGGVGVSLEKARFVPPNVEDMTEALKDLERFIHEDNGLDVLIKAALIHYQLETIHPFLDGNGRDGRLLIVLYLLEEGVLEEPSLYISYYSKMNRIEYYDRLNEVRFKGDYEQWILFFLRGVIETAEDANETIEALVVLNEYNLNKIDNLRSAGKSTNTVFKYLISNPIVDISSTALALYLSYNTVSSALNRLINLNTVKEVSNQERNRVYVYEDFLELLKRGTL